MAKIRTLINTYYDAYTEEDIKEYILCNYDVEEEDITDDMMTEMFYHLLDWDWDDFKYEMERFLDGHTWIMVWTLGLWDGKHRGGFTFTDFDDFCRCFEGCNYIKVTDEDGHLMIQATHHDGTNYYEVKRLTEKGVEYNDTHWDMNPEELHGKLWNSNFMSGLPHFAKTVYGC